jgi:dTDP-3-amino-3,4,6-trideoxy-alpha-D-glucose transaminase
VIRAGVSQASMPVPFVDLGVDHRALKQAILDDVSTLVDSGEFTNGAAVAAFEQAFADFCGAAHCVGTSNGLDALRLALLAADVAPGDEVVVPAHTFAATFEAVIQAGAVPVAADVAETDYNLDLEAAANVIGDRTRFLLPVHLYGQMADMRSLQRLADRHGIALIEDACQAHGAARDGIRAGAGGLAAAFSFYPAKNLGAIGDAGAVVTADPEVAARVRSLREHGQVGKYEHRFVGYTARLDTIQALVLLRKLPLLRGWNARRRAIAGLFHEALGGVGDLRLPPVPSGSDPVWHLYVVRTAEPERLAAFLAARGIETGRHYPQPPHLAAAFEQLGYRAGSFPVTERLAREVLSLPIHAGMRDVQVEAVVEAVESYFRGG